MNDKMYHVFKRFPEKRKAIDLLIAEDSEFRSMCEDYDDCVQACRYWDLSKDPEAETRVNEYQILIRELENEFIETLKGEI